MRIPHLVVLLIAGSWEPAAAQQRPLALDDYYRLETVSSPAISPDGRWVAYLRGTTIEPENRRRNELWLVPFDGSAAPRRLSDSTQSAGDPRWSPDSRVLSFTSPGEGGVVFRRIDRPGDPPFRIPGLMEPPVWSPDGKWIAFTRATPPVAATTPALSPEERKLRERFTGRATEWMGYRFDGRGYLPDPRDPASTPPREVYVLPADGGTARKLTALGVDARELAWRPDGSALAFVADLSQRDERLYERADLFTVSLDGRLSRLTDDGYNHGSPAWTPDGATLVFSRQLGLTQVIAARQDHGAPVDLYRMPATGGAMRNLTADWDLIPGDPEISPDGRYVAFAAGIGGDSHLFRLPLEGGAVEQVTLGARRLGGFSHSAAWDRMAFAGTDPLHPPELFAARGDGREERRLTRLNDALLAEVSLSPVERITYQSRDGTPVEGWIVLPRVAGGTRAPLLLAIHGGPHGAYGTDFSFQFQYWAGHGYAVVFTNPRGSTGYGEKFLWGTWGAWGDRDGEDVLAGVDHVILHYPVDSSRTGVTGYSYGGFLTNWLITQTPRFRAAVTGAGISNWISDYGTADIPRTKESEFYGAPWEARGAETLWRQSPIRYAGQVRTPTMFIHGEADLRVPIEQAEQMYTALQKNGIPGRFVRYPGMYHGGWTPWNMVHRYHEELAWWDRWLRGVTP